MRIAVVGAGLAGLTFALAAERHGLEVELRDERPALGGGAAITLWPTALGALSGLGLGHVVEVLGEPAPSASVRRSDGRVVQRPSVAAVERSLGGVPRVFDRGDLQLALAARVRADVVLGASLAVDEDVDASLLVGADGFRSVVARRLDATIQEGPTGLVAFRGVVDEVVDPSEHGVVWGDGMEAGTAPMRDGRTYWFATSPEVGASRAALLGAVEAWAVPFGRLVEATAEDRVSCVPVVRRGGPARWHDDRSVVIGDAAHPMLPSPVSGGGHAIVDAVVLARLLAEDPVRGAARFEAARRRAAERAVRRSALAWDVAHGTGLLGRTGRIAAAAAPSALAVRALRAVTR